MTRNEVLQQACDQCIKELYEYAVPHVSWEQFKKECEEYSKNYLEWEKNRSNHPEWKDKRIEECIGPRPYEFYYLPREIMKDICESYVYAYNIDHQQNLLDIIKILKDYCNEPIVDKWIEGEGDNPGHRGYEHPDNLEKEINTYLDLKFPLMDPERAEDAEDFENKLDIAAKELQDKFFEFLDMAGKFFNWNRDLNSFNMTVYLGVSPCSNKETVIKNWKKYRDSDIVINEKEIKENYYGEEIDD